MSLVRSIIITWLCLTPLHGLDLSTIFKMTSDNLTIDSIQGVAVGKKVIIDDIDLRCEADELTIIFKGNEILSLQGKNVTNWQMSLDEQTPKKTLLTENRFLKPNLKTLTIKAKQLTYQPHRKVIVLSKGAELTYPYLQLKATAQTMEYHLESQQLVLLNKAIIREKKNSVNGKKIVYDFKKGILKGEQPSQPARFYVD